jgi:arginase
VGIRDLDESEIDYISRKKIITISNYIFSDIQAAINGFNKIYIHIDLDVLDREEFEFTMYPTSDGGKIKDVTQLIKDLKANYDVVGICITESTATILELLKPIWPILEQIEL